MSLSLASERTLADVGQPAVVVPESHPDHLAAIARLLGMRPAPVDRCRVLEIGCGVGINLLPMAERHPASTFVGVDRSSRALAVARQFAAQAGLSNTAFREWNAGQGSAESDTFDYVICHDVYSRLALAEQDALLGYCRGRLSPEGVLYLSARTLPGWIAPGVVRDLARLVSAGVEVANEQLSRARQAIEFLSQSQSADASPWGRMLKRDAALAMSLPEASLAHEYLVGGSHPQLFVELASRAAARGLQYLGDAEIPSMFAASFEPAVQQNLAQVASDTISLEQYMDLLRNRGGRRSLFCHQAARRTFQWTPEGLGGLFLAGNLRAASPPIDYAASEPARFVAADGRAFGVALPAAKAALEAIGAAWPRSVAFESLLQDVTAKLSAGQGAALDDTVRDELARNLIECTVNGLVQVHSDIDRFTCEISARPQVGAWTRVEAASSERVTNRRHVPVVLDEMSRNLLRFLDGSRDRAALLAVLVAAAERGQLSILRGDLPARSSEAAAILEQVLDQALARLATSGLLVA